MPLKPVQVVRQGHGPVFLLGNMVVPGSPSPAPARQQRQIRRARSSRSAGRERPTGSPARVARVRQHGQRLVGVAASTTASKSSASPARGSPPRGPGKRRTVDGAIQANAVRRGAVSGSTYRRAPPARLPLRVVADRQQSVVVEEADDEPRRELPEPFRRRRPDRGTHGIRYWSMNSRLYRSRSKYSPSSSSRRRSCNNSSDWRLKRRTSRNMR